MTLNDKEIRILGSLIEKERSTPDYYPLTENSLLSAYNQKTGRDPVMGLDKQDVESGLDSLRGKCLGAVRQTAGHTGGPFSPGRPDNP